MKGFSNLGLAVLAALVTCPNTVFAQCDVPVNGIPGDGCPDFRYDPSTGLMTFNSDGTPIQSILITGPDPTPAGLLDPDGNWPTAPDLVGNNWTVLNLSGPFPRILTGTYAYFAGRYQNIMFTDNANRGWDNTDDLAIIQYPAGLCSCDFREIEMSTWDTDVNNPPPSRTIIYVIPEPTSLCLLMLAVLGLGLMQRTCVNFAQLRSLIGCFADRERPDPRDSPRPHT